MRTETKIYMVYNFDELSDDAKNSVLEDNIKYLLELPFEFLQSEYPQIVEQIEKCDKMRTPWFIGEYIWDNCMDILVKLAQDYDYLADGEVWRE